jgi:hypothetical protein
MEKKFSLGNTLGLVALETISSLSPSFIVLINRDSSIYTKSIKEICKQVSLIG